MMHVLAKQIHLGGEVSTLLNSTEYGFSKQFPDQYKISKIKRIYFQVLVN
jgi:hypothetical protein